MTCASRAAITLSARHRTSCKRRASGSNPLTGSQVRSGKHPAKPPSVGRMSPRRVTLLVCPRVARGYIGQLPSGSFRVSVYVGIDPPRRRQEPDTRPENRHLHNQRRALRSPERLRLTRRRTGRGCCRRTVHAHPPSGDDRHNAPLADRVYAAGRAILRAPGHPVAAQDDRAACASELRSRFKCSVNSHTVPPAFTGDHKVTAHRAG
jgi:hypothetical protein